MTPPLGTRGPALAASPRRRSRHKQPYSDQPRFRWTSWGCAAAAGCHRAAAPRGRAALNRCTATAYSGFPGAHAQRSCAFAPANPGPGFAAWSRLAYYDAGARGAERDGKTDGNGPERCGQQSSSVSARDPERPGRLGWESSLSQL